MNYKIISVALICCLLLFSATGCSVFGAKDISTDGKTNEERDNAENADLCTEFTGVSIESGSEIYEAIINYLHDKQTDHDMPAAPDLSNNIDQIKGGECELLEVTFDPYSSYYVCAFDARYKINPGNYSHVRAMECSWYLFDCADKIPEYYNDEKCVMTFQFNKASSVTNVISGESAGQIDHFMEYEPKFSEGFNINPPIAFSKTILYMSGTYFDKDSAYYSTSSFYNYYATIRFIEIEGEKYLLPSGRSLTADGEVESLEIVLGKYYDVFAGVANVDKYEALLPDGATFVYSVVALDDFIKVVSAVMAEG